MEKKNGSVYLSNLLEGTFCVLWFEPENLQKYNCRFWLRCPTALASERLYTRKYSVRRDIPTAVIPVKCEL